MDSYQLSFRMDGRITSSWVLHSLMVSACWRKIWPSKDLRRFWFPGSLVLTCFAAEAWYGIDQDTPHMSLFLFWNSPQKKSYIPTILYMFAQLDGLMDFTPAPELSALTSPWHRLDTWVLLWVPLQWASTHFAVPEVPVGVLQKPGGRSRISVGETTSETRRRMARERRGAESSVVSMETLY